MKGSESLFSKNEQKKRVHCANGLLSYKKKKKRMSETTEEGERKQSEEPFLVVREISRNLENVFLLESSVRRLYQLAVERKGLPGILPFLLSSISISLILFFLRTGSWCVAGNLLSRARVEHVSRKAFERFFRQRW
jgi:hypothetical protein